MEAAEEAGAGSAARATGRLVDSTQAEDRRMIALVRERSLLYTRSSLPVASYYSKVKRLWKEVADIMGWTVAEVRRKWSHIRNSYSRHLRNEIHGLRTGRGRAVSRWYLADELEFLRQHMATDARKASYVGATVPTSLLELEPVDVKPFAGAWYAAPEPAPAPSPAPAPDGCCDRAFDLEEDKPYFHFFRGLYSDYQELTPTKQRLFRRKCLLMLHELVEGEEQEAGPAGQARGARGAEADAAMNLTLAAGGREPDNNVTKIKIECFDSFDCSGG